MMNNKKLVILLNTMFVILIAGIIVTEYISTKHQVTYNRNLETDNSNVLRRFSVINTKTGDVEFSIIEAVCREDDFILMFKMNEVFKYENVTSEVKEEDGVYKIHIIGINEDTDKMLVIEDL